MTCYGCINPNNACARCKERLTMTDNVIPFPNPDEVIDTVEQAEADYSRAFDLGYLQGQKAKEVTAGMNEDEKAGFWDGFHDM